MTAKVGLIVGREWSFPPKFIEEVNRRDEGVVAEFAKLGPTAMDTPRDYAVLVDRISHEVPFYRSYLKYAALQGVTVVNNPFMWTADDKFFGAALATKLGIASPRTLLLPNKGYIPAISFSISRGLRMARRFASARGPRTSPRVGPQAGWSAIRVCRCGLRCRRGRGCD